MCSPAVTAAKSPGCGTPSTGSTTSWYEGKVGLGQIIVTGTMEFSGVVPSEHFVSDGPKSCLTLNSCNYAQISLYGSGAMGTCTDQGSDCHCEWTAQAATTGSGSGPFTTSGTSFTWQGINFPYCVTGNTLEIDLSAALADAGVPLVATFTQ